MTDERIAGMITGIQAALVHFAEVLDKKGIVARDELAEGLRATARDLPEAQLTGIVQYMLNHLAQGIEGPADPVEERRRMFRLIQGGRPDQLSEEAR